MSEPTGALRQSDGVMAQQAHGQTVLLRLSDGFYYTLDDVGATVWELCDGQRALEEVVLGVCEQFDAPPDVVRVDVRAFVEELIGERLLSDGT